MSAAPALTPARKVRTRRIEFDYPIEELPKHYVSDDLVMSHVVTVLSSLFPEGEDFFVRSVRKYRDQISDPALKSQVAGFIGQEAMHGREHRGFNERLARLGYPTRRIDRMTGFWLKVGERVLPKPVQLAITAALEHYTATLAEVLLTEPRAREMIDTPEVQSMFLWHALEESEHKAVAFDVYQTVSGSHLIRTTVMNAVTIGFLFAVVLETAISMLGDKDARRNPRRVLRSLRKLRRSPWLTRSVQRRIRDYNRRDFHPDDHDNAALTEQWRVTLFGEGGTLADRLPRPSSGAAAGGQA
jgi:predicted metal-dependent hydrolase